MFVGSTAKPVTRPEVNAGPIERILSPLNVGVDIGSRGVGDASGVGVGDGLAVAVGDGEGVAGGLGGSCATTRSGSRNRSEITVNAHEDIVITVPLVVIEMELVTACEAGESIKQGNNSKSRHEPAKRAEA